MVVASAMRTQVLIARNGILEAAKGKENRSWEPYTVQHDNRSRWRPQAHLEPAWAATLLERLGCHILLFGGWIQIDAVENAKCRTSN
jgi:hypothetical protein